MPSSSRVCCAAVRTFVPLLLGAGLVISTFLFLFGGHKAPLARRRRSIGIAGQTEWHRGSEVSSGYLLARADDERHAAYPTTISMLNRNA